MNQLAIVCADGMEEVEALTAVDLLRRAKLGCDLVSLENGDWIRGSHGIEIRADLPFSRAPWEDYRGLILPGGFRGTQALKQSEALQNLLLDYARQGRLCAAICAAPTVLGRAGLLEGKRACCYPGLEEELWGARVCYDPVAVDGSIITSRGLGTALPFALAIVAYFQGQEAARTLAEKIVFPL